MTAGPDLLRALRAKLRRDMPITKALGLRVVGHESGGLVLSSPLEPNMNHKGTAFAGSLNAAATLAGWGTIPLRERKVYLNGKRPADIESYAREFCQVEMLGKLSFQGRARLEEHRQAGHQLVLVTGAPEFLVVPLAEFLGVSTVFSAKPEQRDGVYTGALIPPFPYGRGKRELILAHAKEMNLDLTHSYAYGDSPGDRDILELVGHPLVVNPIRGMARTAQQQGWSVTIWK